MNCRLKWGHPVKAKCCWKKWRRSTQICRSSASCCRRRRCRMMWRWLTKYAIWTTISRKRRNSSIVSRASWLSAWIKYTSRLARRSGRCMIGSWPIRTGQQSAKSISKGLGSTLKIVKTAMRLSCLSCKNCMEYRPHKLIVRGMKRSLLKSPTWLKKIGKK